VPFTLAHPAAVLPLRRLARLRVAPLILGAMVPDLPYFLPGKFQRIIPETHDFLASITTCLLLGYLALITLLLLRRPLTALLASRARWLCLHALEPFTRLSSAWLWAGPAILLGVWSHLLWDSFTHTDGWVSRRVSALTAPVVIGPYTEPMAHVLQYLSSVLGLAVMIVWYARLPAQRYHADPHEARPPVGPILLLITAAALLIGGVQASDFYAHTHLFYVSMNILLTRSCAWFATLYLVAGLVIAAEHPLDSSGALGEETPDGESRARDTGEHADHREEAPLGEKIQRGQH
jgi:uncharacterized protein DUF4184